MDIQLQPHQQRVVAEKLELDDRLNKLNAFFSTVMYKSLPPEEQDRMTRQSVAMTDYSDVLGERIAAF